MFHRHQAVLSLLVLLLGGPALAQMAPAPKAAPAGSYTLDASHATLTFRVNHLGLSQYTAGFERFDATLAFDPEAPETMQLSATVEVGSLVLPAPPAGFVAEMLSAGWLDAGTHPQMQFRSTAIELTGADTARLTGDLTLRGVTRPVTLDVRYNGGYTDFRPFSNRAQIGFSAVGQLLRSEFGITAGLPPDGSALGVDDRVEVLIEAEFIGPESPEPQPD